MTDELKSNLMTVGKLKKFLEDKPDDANVFVVDPEAHECDRMGGLTTKVRLHFYNGDVFIESK